MARKRYQVEFDEDFYLKAKTGAVARGLSIGQWIESASKIGELSDAVLKIQMKHARPGLDLTGYGGDKEEPMDEIAKKAIEPDKVKKEPMRRPTKGLGEIPGLQRNPYEDFRPAPKPGKSK